jgi:hypothetical protein
MPVLVLVALLWLQLQFGALRVLERLPGTGGHVALGVVWAGSALALWALLTRRLRHTGQVRRVVETPWPSALLAVAVAVCALGVYPSVDGRRSTGGGSDADDAALVVADRVRHGEDPYAVDTYLGNPPTTGPGSTLWTLPLTSRRTYAIGMVVAVVAALAALRRWTRGWSVPSVTALLLAGSFPFWEAIAQGNDHLTMACLLAILVLATTTAANGVPEPTRTRMSWHIIPLVVLAGVVATWRAAYLHLPVLLAVALWRRSRAAAVAVGAGGVAVALALHGAFLARTAGWDAYDPVQQLFVKSGDDLTTGGRVLVAVGTLVAAAVVLTEARRAAPRADVLVLAGIGGPLAAIAVAGVFTADDPAAWSEASYLLPTLVLAAVVTARWAVQSSTP